MTISKWMTPENTREDGMYWDAPAKQWRSVDARSRNVAAFNKSRMWVAGEYISVKDPRYFPGRYATWEEADDARDGVVATPVAPVAEPWRNSEFDENYAPTRNYFRRLDRKHDRECRAGYVYLASNGRCVKIGESVNPDRRIGQGNTFAMPGEEWRIVWAWYVEDRKKAEKDMHKAFAQFNLRLELFELDAETPQAVTGEGWYIVRITRGLGLLDHV